MHFAWLAERYLFATRIHALFFRSQSETKTRYEEFVSTLSILFPYLYIGLFMKLLGRFIGPKGPGSGDQMNGPYSQVVDRKPGDLSCA
jgi:hypothetical protein